MLPRGAVLRNPTLRKEVVLGLYRLLVKELNKQKDAVVRSNLSRLVHSSFRQHSHLSDYRKYSKSIAAAELLATYLLSLSPQSPPPQQLYPIRRKAYKEVLSLAYGKKGPIYDEFSLVKEWELTEQQRMEWKLHGKKVRVKGCNPHTDQPPEYLIAYARQRVKLLPPNGIEFTAYRKALGVPTRFTKEEAEAEKPATQLID